MPKKPTWVASRQPPSNGQTDPPSEQRARRHECRLDPLVAGERERTPQIQDVVRAEVLQVPAAEREAAAGVCAVEEGMPVQLTARQVVLGVIQVLFRGPRLVRLERGRLLGLRLLDERGARGGPDSCAAAGAATHAVRNVPSAAASAGHDVWSSTVSTSAVPASSARVVSRIGEKASVSAATSSRLDLQFVPVSSGRAGVQQSFAEPSRSADRRPVV